MQSYLPELWELYGITSITVWDLLAEEFFAYSRDIDHVRREREKEANKH